MAAPEVAFGAGARAPSAGSSKRGSPSGPARQRTSRASTRASRTVVRKATRKRPRHAPVPLFHVNRRDTMQLRLVDSRGRPVKGAQRQFDNFLRCHHTNKKGRMNPRLMRLIYQVGRHYDGKRIEVISGYRDASVAKNPKSPHKQGAACDIRVQGVANSQLRDYLRKTFDHVGVGYYPNSSFVHIDVRDGASAFWIDYSGPGKNAIYSENPKEDLRTGRAETFKPATIDPSWVDGEQGAEADGCCEDVPPERAANPQADKVPATVAGP